LFKEPVFITAVRNFEELPIKLRQLTRSKVTSLQERVAFQEMGALAEDFSSSDVMFHDCRHTKTLDRAHLHADGTAIIASHDWAATLIDEFILLNTAPPHLVTD
jgi:endonuclease IV